MTRYHYGLSAPYVAIIGSCAAFVASMSAACKPPDVLFDEISPSIVFVVGSNLSSQTLSPGSGVVIQKGIVVTTSIAGAVGAVALNARVRSKKRSSPCLSAAERSIFKDKTVEAEAGVATRAIAAGYDFYLASGTPIAASFLRQPFTIV